MSGVKGAVKGEQCHSYVHGGTGTRLHNIWLSMRERCNRVHHPHYKDYGGRGITICAEWQDFRSFRDWALSHGYSDDLQIDRIDYNGDYDPNNCRWVTAKEQQNNKRNNRRVEYQGNAYTITQLAEFAGLSKTTLKERLNAGWPVDEAVEKPVRMRTRGYRMSRMEEVTE